jgi:FtsH-binding integral membrane protein
VTAAIGFEPFSGAPGAAPHSALVLLFPAAVWWLLETVVVMGLVWHGVKPRRVSVAVWVALVWLLASAARFTPLLLALAVG